MTSILLESELFTDLGNTAGPSIITILIWVTGFLVFLFIFLVLFAPALLAIPYSLILTAFIRNARYVDPQEHFEHASVIKDHWKMIRDEVEQLLKTDIRVPTLDEVDNVQALFAKRDGIPWRTYFIKAFDNWVPRNCSKVPNTYGLLKNMPEVITAMFSIMEPGKHIPGHRGTFKGILRYHLGLIVPGENSSFLEVGKERYYWKEGEHVMFDDTYYHEARNTSSEVRVVLFIDIERNNSLPAWLQPINRRVINYFSKIKRVKKAVVNADIN